MNCKQSLLVIETPKSCSKCKLVCKIVEDFLSNEKNDTYNALMFLENDRHPQCPLQDTTELLEALNNFDEWNCNTVSMIKLINKLHKALGGVQLAKANALEED